MIVYVYTMCVREGRRGGGGGGGGGGREGGRDS